jgi:hypothetical protein
MDRARQGRHGLMRDGLMRRAFIGASMLIAAALLYGLSERVALPLPIPQTPRVGWALAACGLGWLLAALLADRAERDAPPTGIYIWLPEPALLGAVLVSVGAALALRSPFLFWLLTPVVTTAALIFALDNHESTAWLHRRWPVVLLALAPSYAVYASLGLLAGDSGDTWWQDFAWPRTPFTISHFALIALAPFLCQRAWLPRLAHQLWVATGVIVVAIIAIPLLPLPAPLTTDLDGRAAFHVAWAFIGAIAWSSHWPRARVIFGVWAMAVAVSCVMLGATLLEIITGLAAYALGEWQVPETWRAVPDTFRDVPLRVPLACAMWAASVAWLMGESFDLWGLAAAGAVGGCIGLVVAAKSAHDFIAAAAAALAGTRMWQLGFTLPAVAGICILVFAVALLRDPAQRLRALALFTLAGVLLALHVPAYAQLVAPTWRVLAAAGAAALLTGLAQARRRS